MSLNYKMARATEEDKNFIADSFILSLKKGADFSWIEGESGRAFHAEMQRRLEKMLEWDIVVAHGDSSILGWACGSERTWFHYLYVKQPYRMVGIGLALWEALGKPASATHWTRSAAIYSKGRKITYWPVFWRDQK